ncbi:MAG: methyl-accepting chemotaxis protein, partial [Pseudomonadota bacterium]
RMLQKTAEAGVAGPDERFVKMAQMGAAEIARTFARAAERGEISMDDLFDEDYAPIEGSDPAQVETRFSAFTDQVLPPVQEAILGADAGVVFCAAVDRNGYLPTHNAKFSQPQRPDDPVWNAANCRNRRIFDDKTGLAAARSDAPYLVQTYRRDMGGGVFAMMKDISAPIVVDGRHWGGLRVAVKVGD